MKLTLRTWVGVIVLIAFEMDALFERQLEEIHNTKLAMMESSDMDQFPIFSMDQKITHPQSTVVLRDEFRSKDVTLKAGREDGGTKECCSPPLVNTMEDFLKRQEVIKKQFEKSKKEFNKRAKGRELLQLVRRPATPEAIEKLLSNGADINFKDGEKKTPLHWAASEGYAENVQTLLHYGSKIDARDYAGNTPLHFAVRYATPRLGQRKEIIGMLIDGGASIYERDDEGLNVLDITPNNELQKFIKYRSLEVYR